VPANRRAGNGGLSGAASLSPPYPQGHESKLPDFLGHNAFQISRVPSREFAPQPDGPLILPGADEVEGEVPHHGHVLGAEPLSQPGLVLIEGDVQHPVQPVLDPPVPAHRPPGGLGGERGRGDIVPGLGLRLRAALDGSLDADGTGAARQAVCDDAGGFFSGASPCGADRCGGGPGVGTAVGSRV
jgi:hypothetical protein